MQQIPRRLSRCVLGNEPFEPGQKYISVLDVEGNRKDYCPLCWEKTHKPKGGHYWQGKLPLKKEKVTHPDMKALELFRSAQDEKLRFVLALYLQRKQQLLRRTRTLYEVPASGEVFDVPPIALTPQEGETLAQVIDQLLDQLLYEPVN